MWIIDCPLKQGETNTCSYVIGLEDKVYVFGNKRSGSQGPDIPVITGSVISRKQTEFKLDPETGWLLGRNIGARSIKFKTDDDDGGLEEMIPAKGTRWSMKMKSDSVLYKDDSEGVIALKLKNLNVKHIKISKNAYDQLGDLTLDLCLHLGENLNYNEIMIDGQIHTLKNNDEWLGNLLKCNWKKYGGLADFILPELSDDEIVEIPASDDNFSDLEVIPPPPSTSSSKQKRFEPNGEDLEEEGGALLRPPPYLIDSNIPQSTQLNKDTQQESLLGQIMAEVEEDTSFIRSQQIRKRKKKKVNIVSDQQKDPVENNIRESTSVLEEKKQDNDEQLVVLNENMNSLSMKRTKEEPSNDRKRIKNESPSSLVENIIRAKELKKEKIEKENALIEIGSKSSVKVSKFHIQLTMNKEPTFFNSKKTLDKPEWQNRVNFSKFQKVNLIDNPVMDSTIKYIKMKSSKYKSSEIQVSRTTQNYINIEDENIPIFDREFSDSQARGGRSIRKRVRASPKETGLFVASGSDTDEDDLNFNSNSGGGRQSTLRGSSVRPKKNNSRHIPANKTNSMKLSILSDNDEDEQDEDDLPIFKAQRRY